MQASHGSASHSHSDNYNRDWIYTTKVQFSWKAYVTAALHSPTVPGNKQLRISWAGETWLTQGHSMVLAGPCGFLNSFVLRAVLQIEGEYIAYVYLWIHSVSQNLEKHV